MDLWRAAGLRFHPDLVERELASVLARDLVLIEEEAGELTGTVFGTYDGTRGWVHRLATRPDRRGRGIASALLAELERRLRAAGCPKVNLLIEPGHAAVASLYAKLGYRPDELLFMEKWLVAEPDDLYIPNDLVIRPGAGVCPRWLARHPARTVRRTVRLRRRGVDGSAARRVPVRGHPRGRRRHPDPDQGLTPTGPAWPTSTSRHGSR
jgi:GNAT superfamily N-acetyltransferase